MPSTDRLRTALCRAALLGLLAVAGCAREAPPRATPTPPEPAAAVRQLADDLRRHDLVAYTRHAVPPALYAQLEQAWREDRSRWPLTELPLHERLPGFLEALSQPGAEQALQATYRQQFAGAHAELRSAAATISLFAVQYVRQEGDYGADTRDHYVQLIEVLGRWGQRAPLGDPQRAQATLPQLVAAARTTGLGAPGAMRDAGMERSLERLGPFFARLHRVAAAYGLDVDAALASVQAERVEQDGDRARVRVRYTLAGEPIDAHVQLERRDGAWYLSDALRHAEAAVAGPAQVPSGALTATRAGAPSGTSAPATPAGAPAAVDPPAARRPAATPPASAPR